MSIPALSLPDMLPPMWDPQVSLPIEKKTAKGKHLQSLLGALEAKLNYSGWRKSDLQLFTEYYWINSEYYLR